MRKFRNKSMYLLFIIAALVVQIPLSFCLATNFNSVINQKEVINNNSINIIPSNNFQLTDDESDSFLNNNFTIFSESLREYLASLPLNAQFDVKNCRIIVLFEENLSQIQRSRILDSVFEDYKLISHYDIIPGSYIEVNPIELLSKGRDLAEIKEVKHIYKSETFENPYIIDNDLQISDLNENNFPNWWLPAVGAESLAYDGSGVKVAIVDTGIYDHPALNIVANQNFVSDESSLNYNDDVGHGTHVAGIIGGNGMGSDGKYRGMAPGVSLINARAGNASGLEEGDIISAIDWSSKPIGLGGAGADIVSMSFGGGYPYISDLITQAISSAQETYGIIFVASAGNEGTGYFTGSTPASGTDVISVGASDSANELASFSSWGPTFGYIGYPDVVAPGVNIISTEAANSIISKEERFIGNFFDFAGDADYIPLSGTSMAAPMVSGALAILKDAYPNLTPETARIALLKGANRLSNEEDDEIVKSGAGLINVSASLDYLSSISPDYNDTAKVFPNNLPVEPFDLLKFPGDHQKFNLTVISGQSNTFDIEVPNDIPGVTIKLDNYSINFPDSGVGFIELDIEINKNAIPGPRQIQLNLTASGEIYDMIDISLEIELPEYSILMESYHGLNDWFPEFSFRQIGFYEAMSDISDLNISIDYGMEYWTPDYDKDINNSILMEEKLYQYDLIVLQTPILPFSPIEISNIRNYFEKGGNILFLGTRYQDMPVVNINDLFSSLDIGVQINEENIMNDNWYGIATTVTSQSVQNFSNSVIFNNVNRYFWSYGTSFTVFNDGESIASIDGSTVAAFYNGSSYGKGQFLAFGGPHWIFTKYKTSPYSQDHSTLLRNILEHLLPQNEASIDINLESEFTSNPQVDISLYLKNQTQNSPITNTDYDKLEVAIKNDTDVKLIDLNITYASNGIYFNDSFNLPIPSYKPYSIIVNLTIGSKIYSKMSKILYYDSSKLPIINNLTSSESGITRSISESTTLNAELDKSSYNSFNGFLSIYAYSFNNLKNTVNKSLTFGHFGGNDYRYIFDPSTTDPSGYAVFFIEPSNENYTNPYSPRIAFQIINNPPEIIKTTSNFRIDNSADILFDDVESNDGVLVYKANQGSKIDFNIDIRDSVSYEDDNSNMSVFINFLMASVTDDGFIIFIFPASFVVDELLYNPVSDLHEGIFIIPNSLNYYSIIGTKPVSTAASFDFSTNKGYLGVLYITAYDTEGKHDDFIIIMVISAKPGDYSMIFFIVLGVIAIIGIASISLYFVRRKRSRISMQDYYYKPSYEREEDTNITPEWGTQISPTTYCPFCGGAIRSPKKFCPHCGESLNFEQEEE